MCRKPVRANEHQLHYFASKDMGVSHTLFRCFFWSENILWKEDILDRRVTVALAGKDLIVDAKTVKEYLTNNSNVRGESSENGMWGGNELNVLWFPHLDHGQVFDKKITRERLVRITRSYCDEKE